MITPNDTILILAKIAAFDQRTVGRTDIAAWTEVLNLADPPIAVDDALNAISRWQLENTDDRMRVAHVIQGAQHIAARRAGAARLAELEQQRALDAAEPVDRTPEVIEMVKALAARMGTSDRDILRRQEWVKQERQRQRDRIGRNPNYDPRRAADIARRDSA